MRKTLTLPNPTGPQAELRIVKEATVTLQPLVMRWPNRQGVYGPSTLRPRRTLSYHEFLDQYADHPQLIRVCFEETACRETLLRRSQVVTAYSVGLDGWHTIVPTIKR